MTEDDELSESNSRESSVPRPDRPRTLPGFTTPITAQPMQYVGAHPQVPLEQRTGRPEISEQQVMNLLTSQSLTAANRTRAAPEFRPHLLRHNLPLSSAFSTSARPTGQITTPSQPSAVGGSMERITNTFQLMATLRAPGRHQVDVQRAFMQQPLREQVQQTTPVPEPAPPTPPVIYDGADETCSICTEHFVHGERVCRLVCRHVFHAACWEDYQRRTSDRTETCCNCRGAGTLIAVWNYIDMNRITQIVGGTAAPNLLPSTPVTQADRDREYQAVMRMIDIVRDVRSERPAVGGDPPVEANGTAGAPQMEATDPVGAPEVYGPDAPLRDVPMPNAFLVCESTTAEPHYHIQTRMADGRPTLIIDPGSVGNLW